MAKQPRIPVILTVLIVLSMFFVFGCDQEVPAADTGADARATVVVPSASRTSIFAPATESAEAAATSSRTSLGSGHAAASTSPSRSASDSGTAVSASAAQNSQNAATGASAQAAAGSQASASRGRSSAQTSDQNASAAASAAHPTASVAAQSVGGANTTSNTSTNTLSGANGNANASASSARQTGSAATAAASGSQNYTRATEADREFLEEGDSGDSVTALQSTLFILGYMDKVTGYFGTETEAAVKAFQEQNALTADGLVGNSTWDVLLAGNAVAA